MGDMTNNEQPGSEHILIVEDDKNLRDSLFDALSLEGYEVVVAEHGQAALQYLRTGARPCLILLDLMMPVMDGWTLRREILKDQALADIPVVVMTAASQSYASTIDSAAILFKPLAMDDVVGVVQEHCPGGAVA
jgi:CheY-like chemotaxis protein